MPCCLILPVYRCQRLTAQVVQGLMFSPSIKLLASEIYYRLISNGQHRYNGLHLRFEADALSAWAWEDSAQQVNPGNCLHVPSAWQTLS